MKIAAKILTLTSFVLLFSCKAETKEASTSPSNSNIENFKDENPNSSEQSSDENKATADEGEPTIDVGELFGNMGGLAGNNKDRTAREGLFKNGRVNIEYLRSDKGIPMRKTFAKIADITEEEVELVLTLPVQQPHSCTVLLHRIHMDQANDPKIQAYMDGGRSSQGFIDMINEYRDSAKKYEQELLQRTMEAKKEFLFQNKSWIGLANDNLENGYLDTRNKLVYLPLGDLSFADSIVDFQPGKREGRTPELSLGPPESIAPDAFLDCAVLGIGGTLTLFFEDNAIIDVNGPDIYVFELGVIEPTNLEISKDGQNWIGVGQISRGTASIDIRDFVEKDEVFHYVRLTDLQTNSSQPVAEIDAVAAIGGALRMNLNSAVLFETGSHILKEEGREVIQELGTKMATIKKSKITIEGHTDDVGDNASNKTLSQKRAASVTQELQKVITSSKHTWKEVGYGESQPIVANDSDENRAKNRRVEILVTPY